MKRFISFTLKLNDVKISDEIKTFAQKYCEFASGYCIAFGSDEDDIILVQGKIYGPTKTDCNKQLSTLKKNLKLNFKKFGLKSISTILQMDGYTNPFSMF